jgi:hypothetical protein
VLKRRLARAGGDASDAVALQQLLATFSDPMRLPAAVRGGKPSSSGSGSSSSGGGGEAAGDSEIQSDAAAAGGGGGGSVAKGAMLVFERSGAGTVTARVSAINQYPACRSSTATAAAVLTAMYACLCVPCLAGG